MILTKIAMVLFERLEQTSPLELPSGVELGPFCF